MKDNISIIFTAIIATFLIVLLPLYSILDRQDSMSYNVVLTETTNFVDNIRNNGFLDKETYYEYISALASTSNTYKVTLEAYRKTLIHDTDEYGNVIKDSFIEEIELYNTQDILSVIEGETDVDTTSSNQKNNVYLFDVNDEIYVRVYNTNITAGSVIYNVIAGESNSQVINVSYGGVVNNVNWELYDKVQADTTLVPEVVLSVPVNGVNSTNIVKLTADNIPEDIDCSLENLDEYIGETSIEELCRDVIDSVSGENYTYLYDLEKQENKTIRMAVELRRFESISTGKTAAGEDVYTKISELNLADFNDDNGTKSSVESYIVINYIQLNGMYASIDLDLRKIADYYVFDIILTNVRMSELDYISSLASVTILPGLGQDENGTLSIGAETIQIELTDETAVNTVQISEPHIWNKLLKTKSLSDSRILDGIVYAGEDIAFVISYTGINNQTDEDIVNAIKNNLKVYINEAEYSQMEFITAQQLNDTYEINIQTDTAGHVIVKFRYTGANNSKNNYIELLDGWIATNIEEVIEPEENEELLTYASGARSSEYSVLLDDVPPLEPGIELEGILGNNGWYTSDVVLNLIASKSDTVTKTVLFENQDGSTVGESSVELGGSGVYKNTVSITGVNSKPEQEVAQTNLVSDGISYAIGKAYDYVGNVVSTKRQEIKIDKTNPTAPTITLSGTEGINGWYTSNVRVEITPGTDSTSGVDRTTYTIVGANELSETQGTSYTLTKVGTSTIIATTYDKAGNKTETRQDVYIDKSVPPDATIEVISGQKNSPDVDWYYTDVKLKITVDATDSISGLGISSYRVTGNSEVPTTKFEGKTKEITITANGTHNITVYTYTVAGNYKETKYTVNIDKDAPNAPTVTIVGTKGENDWYTSNVEVTVKSNGDVGPSVEKYITYTTTKNGVTTIEKEISNNGKIFLNEEGEYILKVYSRDIALNQVEVERVVKIDKTSPTPAEFVIQGTQGTRGWYTSDVAITHEGAVDNISGIQSVILSTNSITQNTAGTKVTLTTKDNAGHSVTKDITIKLDKYVPEAPIVTLDSNPTGIADGPFGVWLYNKDVGVTINPGKDTFLPNMDNSDRTTYEIVGTDNTTIIPETENLTFNIDWQGQMTIIARTYDKAGNIGIATRTIWIDKSKPSTPKIVSINGTNVENNLLKEISSESNTIDLRIANLAQGNKVTVVLINQSTYEKIQIDNTANASSTIQIVLNKKGTYSIKVTQTNMFGTISDESAGAYLYTYE